MLEIKVQRRRLPRILMLIVLVIILGIGGYFALTVFSPNLPVLSGRALNATQQKLGKSAGSFGDHLFLPQINIDLAITTGSDASALERGAWHRKPKNGDPAHGGNFVLSAHRFIMGTSPQDTVAKSPFYNIGKLQLGDRIFVDYAGIRYQYEISEKYTVKPDGVEVEVPTKDPQLTLYSCNAEGNSDGRDVLEAKFISKQ